MVILLSSMLQYPLLTLYFGNSVAGMLLQNSAANLLQCLKNAEKPDLDTPCEIT